MRNFDFSPLYSSSIGFDHLSSLLDTITRSDTAASNYPPYNIELIDKDHYQITMAVAGFVAKEIEVQTEKLTLTVKGKKHDTETKRNYLHHGIAARNFSRCFQLADHIEVTSARIANGLLHVELVRQVPEAMKPKNIPIESENESFFDVNSKDAA